VIEKASCETRHASTWCAFAIEMATEATCASRLPLNAIRMWRCVAVDQRLQSFDLGDQPQDVGAGVRNESSILGRRQRRRNAIAALACQSHNAPRGVFRFDDPLRNVNPRAGRCLFCSPFDVREFVVGEWVGSHDKGTSVMKRRSPDQHRVRHGWGSCVHAHNRVRRVRFDGHCRIALLTKQPPH